MKREVNTSNAANTLRGYGIDIRNENKFFHKTQ